MTPARAPIVLPATAREPAPDANTGRVEQPKPRVAFLTNFIPPYRTATLAELQKLCDRLQILISTPMEENRPGWRTQWSGLDVVLQKTVTIERSLKDPLRRGEAGYLHLPLDTLSRIRDFRPDVVISVEMGFRSLLALIACRAFCHSRFLIWVDVAESTEVCRGASRMLLRRLLVQAADGFIVNGASGARYLRQLGVRDEQMVRIPYATDVERFFRPASPICPGKRKLLYVGQLIERKGLLPFLVALCRWALEHPQSEIEFTLAGDGPVRSTLESISLPPNLQLRILGTVCYEKLPAVYGQADIFAFPSLADTWGLVVNEAMAAGLPVLGSRGAQAVEEMVREGSNGWVFPPSDADALGHAIDRCMAAPIEVLRGMQSEAQCTALRLTPAYVASLIKRTIEGQTEGDQCFAAALSTSAVP
jgi:glycosyltransferase involved in cell wall biosynthesis